MAIESVSFGSHFWSRDIFHNELKSPTACYWTLLDERDAPDERVAGYGGFWRMRDEAHLTTIAIDPTLRGLSLGELFHCHLLGSALRLGARWITTEIRVSNHPSQNMCYKYGFYAVGLRRRYYQNNEEDALVVVSPDLRGRDWQSLYARRKTELRARIGGVWPQGFAL